jgi:putative nucleotidyltransferase with HDIG domain
MSEGITLKGEFQGNPERLLRWLFGLDSPLNRRDWALISYTGWLAVLFSALVAAVLLNDPGPVHGPVWPMAVLAVSALVAERQSVRLTSRAAVSVSSLPIVLAAVIYGPFAAIVVSVASLLCDFRAPYARWITWTSSRSIAAGCAGAVTLYLDGTGSHGFGRVVAAVAVATLIEQVGDLLLGSVAARLRGMTAREIAKLSTTIFLAQPLYVPIAAVLVYTYREVSPWSVALFLFPAFAAQKFFLLYQEQRATAQELATAMEQQEKANLSFASALVATLDARDRYTAGHSAAVAVYARDIASRLGLSATEQDLAHLCGLVHDIGKVGLPAGLLEKPGPLTLEERRQMEEHSVIGERILENVEGYEKIAHVVRHHHERIDGQGYPDRLTAEGIPLLARIIAVADAYDAMTSDRPYRDSMPSRVARLRMAQAVGSQFDTGVVAAFEAILAQAPEDYRIGVGDEFTFGAQSMRSYRGAIEMVGAPVGLRAVEAQAC